MFSGYMVFGKYPLHHSQHDEKPSCHSNLTSLNNQFHNTRPISTPKHFL